jgi:hypothetical protein
MTISEQELFDRAEITDVLTAYCQAQDQEEWHLLDKVFVPDAVIEIAGMGYPAQSPAQMRELLQDFSKDRISGQHMIGNIIFDIDADRAKTVCEVIYITLHPADDPKRVKRIRGNALYSDELVRLESEWRIRKRVIAQKNVETDETEYDPSLLKAIRTTAKTRWFSDIQGQ